MSALEAKCKNEFVNVGSEISYRDWYSKAVFVPRLRLATAAHIYRRNGIAEITEKRNLRLPRRPVRADAVKENDKLASPVDPFECDVNSSDCAVL
jgi:hypothetical protein